MCVYIFTHIQLRMPHGWKVAASCRGGQKHTTHSDIKYIQLLFRPGRPQLGKFPTDFHSVLVFWTTFLWKASYCFFPPLPPSHPWPFYPYQPKFRVRHLCTEQAIKYSAAQRWIPVLWAHGFFFASTDFMIKRVLPFGFSFKWKSSLSTSKSGFKWMFVIQAWLLQQHKRKVGEKLEIIT